MVQGRYPLCLFGAVTLALAACVTTQEHEKEVEVPPEVMTSFLEDKPVRAYKLYGKVLTQGERNAVLNHMRSGLAAMELGAYEAAERSFDRALLGIETIYAENPDAEAARSLWIKENRKDFKGEPYERAMAYYYRGLLYLREGDYENARASFRGGMLQDTLAEDETYSQDFGLLAFLDGWASHCNGDFDLAEESFAEAREHVPWLARPGASVNLLLLAETGRGPRKIATGEYLELLTFARGAGFGDTQARFLVGNEAVPAELAEDLFFQATTRGGRQVDHVLDGKASFKSGTDTVGDVMLAAGVAAAHTGASYGNEDAALAGAVIALGGLVAKGIAGAMRPEADTRTWDNLPDRVHLAVAQSPAGRDSIKVQFLDQKSVPINFNQDMQDPAMYADGNCAIAWARAHSALAVAASAPGS